jgi:hypothetical protein
MYVTMDYKESSLPLLLPISLLCYFGRIGHVVDFMSLCHNLRLLYIVSVAACRVLTAHRTGKYMTGRHVDVTMCKQRDMNNSMTMSMCNEIGSKWSVTRRCRTFQCLLRLLLV